MTTAHLAENNELEGTMRYTKFLKNPIEQVIPQLREHRGRPHLLDKVETIERAKLEVHAAYQALEAARKNLREAKAAAKAGVEKFYTQSEVEAADARVTAKYSKED